MSEPFAPHPNLSKEINDAISTSEAEGGAWLAKLAEGRKLYVTTKHRVYTIERRADGLYIIGHPKYCPDWVRVTIPGSNFGGSMLKIGFVGPGLYMEFYPDGRAYDKGPVTTSQILDVTEV